MATILADLHLAEAQADYQFSNRDTAQMAFNVLEKQIFAKHEVPDSVFKQSYDYYLLYLKEFDQIYAAVVDTLNLRELKAQQRDTLQTYPGAHPPVLAPVPAQPEAPAPVKAESEVIIN
ncbi:hypothetical protein BH24BAC1_BH24BAC1_00560 [soil metagenome]